MARPPPQNKRGLTLIEVMVALSVLLVGLLGVLQLLFVGIGSNTGGRMQTQATEIARELAGGLERLQFADPLVSEAGAVGSSAPTLFGWLVSSSGSIATGTGIHLWDDASPVPGVRLSTALPVGYTRRWTVWGFASSGVIAATRIVAVSVTWSEPAIGRPREVLLYTQIGNPAQLMRSIQ